MLHFALLNFRKTWQTFLQCFSNHQLVNGFNCWQFVVNASRISQSYFCVVRPTHISMALAVRAVSPLFFFSGCCSGFSRATRRSHERGSKNWRKKERLLAVYSLTCYCNIAITITLTHSVTHRPTTIIAITIAITHLLTHSIAIAITHSLTHSLN